MREALSLSVRDSNCRYSRVARLRMSASVTLFIWPITSDGDSRRPDAVETIAMSRSLPAGRPSIQADAAYGSLEYHVLAI